MYTCITLNIFIIAISVFQKIQKSQKIKDGTVCDKFTSYLTFYAIFGHYNSNTISLKIYISYNYKIYLVY